MPALPALAIHMQSYTYEYTTENIKKEIILQIEYRPPQTEVTYFNEYGDKDVTLFQGNTQTVYATYYNPDRELTETSFYDYAQEKIILSGVVSAKYPMQLPTFENNGSLLYLFSVYYPEPGNTLRFKMVQSNLSRITDPLLRMLISHMVGPVEMKLKHVGQETLSINGQEQLTDKYEFGIGDGRLKRFWPHKYYFWYRPQDRVLLKHTGISNNQQPNQYILIGSRSWEQPDPELPSL